MPRPVRFWTCSTLNRKTASRLSSIRPPARWTKRPRTRTKLDRQLQSHDGVAFSALASWPAPFSLPKRKVCPAKTPSRFIAFRPSVRKTSAEDHHAEAMRACSLIIHILLRPSEQMDDARQRYRDKQKARQ